MTTTYGMATETAMSMEEADDAVRAALADEGFGVLSEIDVARTLETKIGVHRPPYKILGACNPHLANRALEADALMGLLLPCNVVIAESAGGTTVAIVDPDAMLGVAGDDEAITTIAAEAKAKLERVLKAVASL